MGPALALATGVRWLCLIATLAGCAFQVNGLGAPPIGSGGAGDEVAPSQSQSQPDPPDLGSPSAMEPMPTPMPDLAAPPAPAIDIGKACDPRKPDCATGESCLTRVGTVNVPGGYCTIGCNTTPCPTGAQCAGNDGSKLCLEECPATGCRTGYVCCTKNFAPPGVCTLAQFCN